MSTLQETNTKRKHRILALVALSIVIVILFFGLWPHSWPNINDAQLLPSEGTLRFQGSGIAYTDQVPSLNSEDSPDNFTMHLSMAPETVLRNGFKPILMFSNGDDLSQFTIWNWGASLIVMNGNDYNYARKMPRISALNSLNAKENLFLTISTDDRGTRLFINGGIVTETKGLQLTIPYTGKPPRLIFGNSVYGKHGWTGNLRYFALYAKSFSDEDVRQYYSRWLTDNDTLANSSSDVRLLYRFNTIENQRIPSQSRPNVPLHLPLKIMVFKRTFLTMPPYDFKANRSFWTDTILNFLGFIPLGAVACTWLHQKTTFPRKKTIFLSIAFCFTLSLTIEIIQGWLPHRSSSLLDLILNTLGSLLGILIITLLLKTRRHEKSTM